MTRDLAALKTRTVLALVGIVVGTTALITLLHVTYTARAAAMNQFAGLGTDVMLAVPQPTNDGRAGLLPLDVAQSTLNPAMGVKESSPLYLRSGVVSHGRLQAYGSIVAATDNIYAISGASVASGRATSVFDRTAPYAVLGSQLAKSIGLPDRLPARGTSIRLDRTHVFTVIGILADVTPNSVLNLDLNNSMIVSVDASKRLARPRSVDGIAIKVFDDADDAATAATIEAALNEKMPVGWVQVQSATQLIESIDEQMRIYAVLLVGIGTVATFVSGVGIMNVMLFSVIERRQEIGLRRALGARKSDIRFGFLLEAILLSAFGSSIGIGFGYFGGWGFSELSGTAFTPSPLAIPLGIAMALFVGLVFGMIPAVRASRLNPIEALRSEQ